MKHMDIQLQALDDILSQVRTQNGRHHDAHVQSLTGLATTVRQSYTSIGEHFEQSSLRARAVEEDVKSQTAALAANLKPLDQDVKAPLAGLRNEISTKCLTEYTSTGTTPQKTQYQHTSTLPRTTEHEILLAGFRNATSPTRAAGPGRASPSKSIIFTDASADAEASNPHHTPRISTPTDTTSRKPFPRPDSAQGGLREIDVNVTATGAALAAPHEANKAKGAERLQPPLKRQNTGVVAGGYGHPAPGAEPKDFGASVGSKLPKRAAAEGRENVPFGASVGGGRQLRNRGS